MQLHDKNNITENKLIVLYMLHKFKAPLTFEFMFDFISLKDWMTYFDMHQIMLDLTDEGLIKAEDNQYETTLQGVNVLEEFRKRIPFSVRRDIENHAIIFRTPVLENMQIKADYEQDSQNEFPVTLEIFENKIRVFSLKVVAASGREAEQICESFRSQAGVIYSTALSMLSSDLSE